MLRPDLAPLDAFLGDALSLEPAEFLERHPWPTLVIPEPDWETIRKLSRPETRVPGVNAPAFDAWLDPANSSSGASLDVLCLPLRPLEGGDPNRITIGRAEDSDVILLDDTISKLHAEVSWDPRASRAVLTDLKSRNGTYVDGHRLSGHEQVELISGAVVAFGSLVTRFYLPQAFFSWLSTGASRAGASPSRGWPKAR
jgi:hypothetical protein